MQKWIQWHGNPIGHWDCVDSTKLQFFQFLVEFKIKSTEKSDYQKVTSLDKDYTYVKHNVNKNRVID